MTNAIDFWFDFSSPYAYLAAMQIDALGERFQRQVNWHPILLGVIFQQTGGAPLTTLPLKGEYGKHDFARSARFLNIPFQQPSQFPVPTQQAARAMYWMEDMHPAIAHDFARAVFRALFAADRNIAQAEVVLAIAREVDARIDTAALAAAMQSEPLKTRLRQATEQALALGIFGAPFFRIDNEFFWGVDRWPQMERWLAQGGF